MYRQVKQNDASDIGGDLSRKTGGNLILDIGGSHAEEARQQIYLKAGLDVVIEAGVQITLKAAGSFINIGPAGVAIQGTMVLINSGGAPGSGTPKSAPSIPPVKPVDPPEAGSPDYNIFMPTNVGDPADASGSTAVTPSQTEDE
jgi:type VI secretion system secreted protein VgrG